MNTRSFIPSHCGALSAALMTLLLSGAWSRASAEITDQELNRFVRGYLQAAQQPTPEAELDHYADRVRYFDNGTVNRDFIAQDQLRYYKHWPQRSFELLDGPVITDHENDAATVKFTIRYDVSGAGRHAGGITENTMRVQRLGDGLRIVAMSERKVNPGEVPRPSAKPREQGPIAKSDTPAPTSNASRIPASPLPAGPPTVTQKRPVQKSGAQASTTAPPSQRSGDAVATPAPRDALPENATPVPGSPGLVYPPGVEHTPRNAIDVRGYSPGQKVKDPRTGQIFIVP